MVASQRSANPGTPPTLDTVALARWQSRAAPISPWLHEEVGARMQEKLDWIVRSPQAWCDWQPVRGGQDAHGRVAARYPKAQQWIVEPQTAHAAAARRRWQASAWARLVPGAAKVQFAEPAADSMDMVWANMALHLCDNPPALIATWARWLKADGFVMFSCLGPDTLAELRSLYRDLAWPPPAQAFTDMHDLGDMLIAQGFSEPVMDMEHIHLEFDSGERVLAELRELGRNLHPARFGGLRGRRWRDALLSALSAPRTDGNKIRITFEVVYGHAFKAPPKMQVAEQTRISLEQMRQSLRRR